MVVVDGKHLASRHRHLQTVYVIHTDLPESSPSCSVHFFIIQLLHLYLLLVHRTSPSVHSTSSSVSSFSLQDFPFCPSNFVICIFFQFTGHPLLSIQLRHLYLLSVYRTSPSVHSTSSSVSSVQFTGLPLLFIQLLHLYHIQCTGHPLLFIQLLHLYLLSVYKTSPSVHSTSSSVSSFSLQDIPFCSFNFFICIFCQFTGHPLLFIQLLHLYLLSVYRTSPSVHSTSSSVSSFSLKDIPFCSVCFFIIMSLLNFSVLCRFS